MDKSTLNSDYIYYLYSGVTLLEKEFQNKEKNYVLIPANHFLQNPLNHQTSTILALEKSEIIIFNKSNLFDTLEKENILVSFIWYLVNDMYKTARINLFPSYSNTRQKLLYVLKRIAELYINRELSNSVITLPNWLKTKHLSLLCHCSFRAVYYNLKKLEEEKVLTFYAPIKRIDLNKVTKIIKY